MQQFFLFNFLRNIFVLNVDLALFVFVVAILDALVLTVYLVTKIFNMYSFWFSKLQGKKLKVFWNVKSGCETVELLKNSS